MRNTIIFNDVALIVRDVFGKQNVDVIKSTDKIEEITLKIEERINVKLEPSDIPDKCDINFLVDVVQEKINYRMMKKYMPDIDYV